MFVKLTATLVCLGSRWSMVQVHPALFVSVIAQLVEQKVECKSCFVISAAVYFLSLVQFRFTLTYDDVVQW